MENLNINAKKYCRFGSQKVKWSAILWNSWSIFFLTRIDFWTISIMLIRFPSSMWLVFVGAAISIWGQEICYKIIETYSWHLASARFLFLFPTIQSLMDNVWSIRSSWTLLWVSLFTKQLTVQRGRVPSVCYQVRRDNKVYGLIQSSSTRKHQDIQGSSNILD